MISLTTLARRFKRRCCLTANVLILNSTFAWSASSELDLEQATNDTLNDLYIAAIEHEALLVETVVLLQTIQSPWENDKASTLLQQAIPILEPNEPLPDTPSDLITFLNNKLAEFNAQRKTSEALWDQLHREHVAGRFLSSAQVLLRARANKGRIEIRDGWSQILNDPYFLKLCAQKTNEQDSVLSRIRPLCQKPKVVPADFDVSQLDSLLAPVMAEANLLIDNMMHERWCNAEKIPPKEKIHPACTIAKQNQQRIKNKIQKGEKLKAPSESYGMTLALESELRRNFAEIRRIQYVALQVLRKLGKPIEACSTDKDWMTLELNPACLEEIEKGWLAHKAAYPKLLDNLLRHWAGRSAQAILIPELLGCIDPSYSDSLRKTLSEPVRAKEKRLPDCSTHPTVVALANMLEINDISSWVVSNYSLDESHSETLQQINDILSPFKQLIEQPLNITEITGGSMSLYLQSIVPTKDKKNLQVSFSLEQDHTSQNKRGLEFTGIDVTFEGVPSNPAVDLTVEKILEKGEVHIDHQRFRGWLKQQGLPTSLYKIVNSAKAEQLTTGVLPIIPNKVFLSLPWGKVEVSEGELCYLDWNFSKSSEVAAQCMTKALNDFVRQTLLDPSKSWFQTSLPKPIQTYLDEYRQQWIDQLSEHDIRLQDGKVHVGFGFQPGFTVKIARDGSISVLDQEAVIINMEKHLYQKNLDGIPWIRFQVDWDNKPINADVFWTADPFSEQLLGSAKQTPAGIWIWKPNRDVVKLNGFTELTVDQMRYDPSATILSIDISRAILVGSIKIYDASVQINRNLEVELKVPDVDVLYDQVSSQLAKSGLGVISKEDIKVNWQSGHYVVSFEGPSSKTSYHVVLEPGFESHLASIYTQELAEQASEDLELILTERRIDPEIRLGQIRLKQLCDNSELSSCTVYFSDISTVGSECEFFSWKVDDPAVCATEGQRQCINERLSRQWAAPGITQILSLCGEKNPLALKAKLQVEVETLNEPVDGQMSIDLTTGKLIIEDNLETRILEAIKLKANTLLPTDQDINVIKEERETYIAALNQACDSLMNTFMGLPNITVVPMVNGQTRCTDETWTLDELRGSFPVSFNIRLGEDTESFELSGISWSLANGLHFDEPKLSPEGFFERALSKLIPDALTNKHVTVNSNAVPEGFVISATVQLQLPLNKQHTIDVPFMIRVSADGITINQSFSSLLVQSAAEKVRSMLPYATTLEEWGKIQFVNLQANSDKFIFDGTVELNFDKKYLIPIAVTLDLDTGNITYSEPDPSRLINTVIEPFTQSAEQYFQSLEFGGLFTLDREPIISNCDAGITSCVVGFKVKADLSNFGASGDYQIGLVTVSQDGLDFKAEGGLSVPLIQKIPLPPIALLNMQIALSKDTALNGTVSWPDETRVVAIDATLKELHGDKSGMEIGGPISLMEFVPAGRTDARFSEETLTAGVDIGGALRKVLRARGCLFAGKGEQNACNDLGYSIKEICGDNESYQDNGALECTRGHIFQLIHGHSVLQMSKIGRLEASQYASLILFESNAEFKTEEKLRNPNLGATGAVTVSGFDLAGIDAHISMTGASFGFSFLGAKLTLVVKDLHKMDKETLKALILRMLLPDINLEELLNAILSGDVTLNPFSAFGSGGGDMNGDGNDQEGESGQGGGDTGSKESKLEGPIACAKEPCDGPIPCTEGFCEGEHICTELPCEDGRIKAPKDQWRELEQDGKRSLGPIAELKPGVIKDLLPRSLRPEDKLYEEIQKHFKNSEDRQTANKAVSSILGGEETISMYIQPYSKKDGWSRIQFSHQQNGSYSCSYVTPNKITDNIDIIVQRNGKRVLNGAILDEVCKGHSFRLMIKESGASEYLIIQIYQTFLDKLPNFLRFNTFGIATKEIDYELLFKPRSERDAAFQSIIEYWRNNCEYKTSDDKDICDLSQRPELHTKSYFLKKLDEKKWLFASSSKGENADYVPCYLLLPISDLPTHEMAKWLDSIDMCSGRLKKRLQHENKEIFFISSEHTPDEADTFRFAAWPSKNVGQIRLTGNSERLLNDTNVKQALLRSQRFPEIIMKASENVVALLVPEQSIFIYDPRCSNKVTILNAKEFSAFSEKYTSKDSSCQSDKPESCMEAVTEVVGGEFKYEQIKPYANSFGWFSAPRNWFCTE
ncbi:hypothetical protein [Vibrio alfacsensis]|uniref:hypothetical protein n=1 Tax=Vibrio alfacsensis TaxID=1074311 RepID=UPI004069307A